MVHYSHNRAISIKPFMVTTVLECPGNLIKFAVSPGIVLEFDRTKIIIFK